MNKQFLGILSLMLLILVISQTNLEQVKSATIVPSLDVTPTLDTDVSEQNDIFADSRQTLGNAASFDVALGDLDGDGDSDAFVANSNNQPDKIWLNNGLGIFTDSGQNLGSLNSRAVALGDLDGDNDMDAVVAANTNAQSNKVWLNDGTGTFSEGQNLTNSGTSHGIALGDFDGDEDLDIFVVNSNQGNKVWLNNGAGTFTDSEQTLGNLTGINVALGDVDGDNDLDAFVSNHAQPNKVWINNGNGQFSDSGQSLGNGISSNAETLGDLDSDGDLDVFVSNYGEASRVWVNNGLGIFTDSGQLLGNSLGQGAALGDFDGDGDLDVFASNDGANIVWLNNGSGVFSEVQSLSNANSVNSDVDDLDGDGDLDVFVPNYVQANKVWLNQINNGGGTDSTPPAAITNLQANTGSSSGTVNLIWVAPGDDGNSGTADRYIVRYSSSAITSAAAWNSATTVTGEPTPRVAGSTETMTVSGLTPEQRYYFAIKSQDEVPNISALSNSPNAIAGSQPPNQGANIYLPVLMHDYNPSYEYASEHIIASIGGTVKLGNATLSIPPNALSEDTTITLSQLKNRFTLTEDGQQSLVMEPSGLVFNFPVTLDFSYDAPAMFDQHAFTVWTFDDNTTSWEQNPILEHNISNRVVTVSVSHFSDLVIYKDEPVYLVLQLPPEYLKPGDILYALTNSPIFGTNNWLPGHVGIFSDTVEISGQLKGRIIESAQYGSIPRPWCSIIPGGVRERYWDEFINDYGLDMGARRPLGIDDDLAQSARDFAVQQVGKGYVLLGGGSPFTFPTGPLCFSCVGLVEASYKEAGVDIIPFYQQWPLTPLEQFQATEAVNEISVKVGDLVRFEVDSVVKRQSNLLTYHYEYAGTSTITIENKPDGSNLDAIGNFRWSPRISQAGQTFTMTFVTEVTIDGTDYTATQPFTVHVDEVPVTVEEVYTADYWGTPKTTFQPGELVRFVIRANNPATEAIETTWRWQTADPSGNILAYLTTEELIDTPSGESIWNLKRGISVNATPGTYTFSGSVGSDTAEATFTVAGSPIQTRLLEAVTAKSVAADGDPVDVTSNFQTSDTYVYGWSIWDGLSGTHTITWKWYKPDGTLATIVPYEFTATENAMYKLWSFMSVSSMNNQLGQWKIEVYMDNALTDTLFFTLE